MTIKVAENPRSLSAHHASKVSEASSKTANLDGLNFILRHFEGDTQPVWPRTVSTYATGGAQVPVYDEEMAISLFEESDWVDVRVNAFPYLDGLENKWWKPPSVPNFLFIDIDDATFGNDKAKTQKALSATLKNIRKDLGSNCQPTALDSGRGVHILLPLDMPVPLENVAELVRIDSQRLSEKFLRYLEKRLSKGKADPSHNISFKSCMLRIPFSDNSKCIYAGYQETRIRILQEWNGYRPHPHRLLMYDFRAYLVNERIKEIKSLRRRRKRVCYQTGGDNFPSQIAWIERLLEIPIDDYRRHAVALILAPYLLHIKKLTHDQAFQVMMDWLGRCNKVRRLDWRPRPFVKDAIKTAIKSKILPMRLDTLKSKNPDLHRKVQTMTD